MKMLVLIVLMALGTVSATAQTYPERPVLLIAPFAAGTTADVGGRIIAEALSKRLGQRFVIENVPGSLGQLGVERLFTKEANGYTLCYCNDGPVVTVPASYLAAEQTPPYGPASFVAIGQTIEMTFLLAGFHKASR